jgi:hypothetical protein
MNLDRIIQKVLREQDQTKTKGLTDGADILRKGMQYCETFARLVTGRSIKELPSSEISKFPELGNQTKVAYITSEPNENGVSKIFFGVVDPSVTDKVSYLTYGIQSGKTPKKYNQGWGYDCDKIQQLSQLGKDTLTPEQKRYLDDYIATNKSTVAEFEPTSNMGEWSKKPYTEIIPGYKGEGYVWTQTSLKNVDRNVLGDISKLLDSQGFTMREADLPADSAEANAGVLLKDLAVDYPSLKAAATKSPNTKVYLKANSLPTPNKETCKSIITKLYNCQTQKGISSSDCRTKLWANKITAIQCQNKKYVGGPFGLKDEFKNLLDDGTSPYGLSKLTSALSRGTEIPSTPAQDYSIKESIQKIVSRSLNEEFKKIYRY